MITEEMVRANLDAVWEATHPGQVRYGQGNWVNCSGFKAGVVYYQVQLPDGAGAVRANNSIGERKYEFLVERGHCFLDLNEAEAVCSSLSKRPGWEEALVVTFVST